MIKRILLPLDPSDYTKVATEYACKIAKDQGAVVNGMVIIDIPGIEKSIGPIPAGASEYAKLIKSDRIQEMKERMEKLISDFRDKCEKEGIEYVKTEIEGSPSGQISNHAIFYDLVIMGLRTYYSFDAEEEGGDSLDEVLDQSITPVLAVPDKFEPVKNILIPFDGSFPAAKALQRFSHFAVSRNYRYRIVYSGDDKRLGEYYLDQAKAYLRTYGIDDVELVRTSESIIDTVLTKEKDWADMVVLGGHSKSFLKEFFVGSLTKKLIKDGSKPLFIGF
jgi:nucleotide-binding universal stress UspA family protein